MGKNICFVITDPNNFSEYKQFPDYLNQDNISFLITEEIHNQKVFADYKQFVIEEYSKDVPYYLEYNLNSKRHFVSYQIYKALTRITEDNFFDAVVFLSDPIDATVTLQAKKSTGLMKNTNIILNTCVNTDNITNFTTLQKQIALRESALQNADTIVDSENFELLNYEENSFVDYKSLNTIPKVSVVIPYYNTGKFVEETIKSVENNNYPDLKIILINDGSTDEYSINIINKLENTGKYKIIHTENKGPAHARNLGIQNTNGEYILFIDSDDVISSSYIAKSINCLINNQDITFVTTFYNFVTEDLKDLLHYHIVYSDVPRTVALGQQLFPGMFRKSDIENIKFDESLIRHEDWDFYLTIYERGLRGLIIPEMLYNYRKRWNSLTHTFKKDEKEQIREYIYQKHRGFFDNLQINPTKVENILLNIRDLIETPDFENSIKELTNYAENKKVCFYGAGMAAKLIFEKFNLSSLNILGFIDGNPQKSGQEFCGYNIYSVDNLQELNPDILVLTIAEKQYILPYIENLKNKNNLEFEVYSRLFS